MRGDDKFLGNLVVAALNVYGDKLPVFLGFYQGFYLLLVDFLGQIPFFVYRVILGRHHKSLCRQRSASINADGKDKGTDMEQLLVQLQLGE